MGLAVIDRTKQNHAIEHATIAMLLEMGARSPLAGNAIPGRFLVLWCGSETKDVVSSASGALRYLQDG